MLIDRIVAYNLAVVVESDDEYHWLYATVHQSLQRVDTCFTQQHAGSETGHCEKQITHSVNSPPLFGIGGACVTHDALSIMHCRLWVTSEVVACLHLLELVVGEVDIQDLPRGIAFVAVSDAPSFLAYHSEEISHWRRGIGKDVVYQC